LNCFIDIDRFIEEKGEQFRLRISYNSLFFIKCNPIVPLRKVNDSFFFLFRGLSSTKQKSIPRSTHVDHSSIMLKCFSSSKEHGRR